MKTTPMHYSLRDEFEYRIRTALAYGRARGKYDEAVDESWVQREINEAVTARRIVNARAAQDGKSNG